MKLVVGLGNPGKQYEKTRHNIGFMVLDQLAKEFNFKIDKKKFKSLTAEKKIGRSKIIFLKPQTYMNLSGEAVWPALKFYKINPVDLIIVQDDIDMESGKVRYRTKGSSGGHNGLKDIITKLGTQEFQRVKIGIGRSANVVDHVLDKIAKNEEEIFRDAIEKACIKVKELL